MFNQSRVIIEDVSPQINGGLFPVKRVIDEMVNIKATVICDGHDVILAGVLYKHKSQKKWTEVRMNPGNDDEWTGAFNVSKQGETEFYIEGWVDYALNWQQGIIKKINDGQHVKPELLEGAEYLSSILKKSTKKDAEALKSAISILNDPSSYDKGIEICRSETLTKLLYK